MKILQITSDLDGGGVDRLLYDYCRRMIPKIQFDFVVTAEKEGLLEQPLRDLGCNIFRVAKFRNGMNEHKQQLRKIVTEGHYDIIHDHSGYKAFVNLKIAKECGIKVRLAHSHQAFMAETIKAKLIRLLVTPITKMYATDLFACGNDAAQWMWGKKDYKSGHVHIMTNAIDIKNFEFSESTRQEMRKVLGIENKFVIGNVARFSYQKNHKFLIDIFQELKSKNKDAVLLLVGGGELEKEIKSKVELFDLEDSVFFLGIRNDVPRLMSAMDAFVLPSYFEGLPVTLVEAQAAALPSYVSNAITKEVGITDYIKYISISSSPSEWAEKILEANEFERKDNYDLISKGGYNIEKESNEMYRWYSCAVMRN